MVATVLSLMAATWCWAADLHSPRTCVYDRAQCEELIRLRRIGVCTPTSEHWSVQPER
jgi:hypothetical protein